MLGVRPRLQLAEALQAARCALARYASTCFTYLGAYGLTRG